MSSRLDTSALTEPLAPSELPEPSRAPRAGAVFALAFLLLTAGAGATWWSFPLDLDGGPRLVLTLFVIVAGLAGFCLWLALAVRRKARANAELRHRLSRFAAANRRTLLLDQPQPGIPGLIFTQGAQRASPETLRWTVHGPVEAANYRFLLQRGRSSRIFEGGYLAVRTGTELPPLVLEPARTRGILRRHLIVLPSSFHPVPLRGPDGTRFRLWSAPEHAAQATAVLTPELLALLRPHARDLEITDGTVLIYSADPLLTLDPALWAWIEEVVTALQPHESGQRPHLVGEEFLARRERVAPILPEDLEADRPEH